MSASGRGGIALIDGGESTTMWTSVEELPERDSENLFRYLTTNVMMSPAHLRISRPVSGLRCGGLKQVLQQDDVEPTELSWIMRSRHRDRHGKSSESTVCKRSTCR